MRRTRDGGHGRPWPWPPSRVRRIPTAATAVGPDMPPAPACARGLRLPVARRNVPERVPYVLDATISDCTRLYVTTCATIRCCLTQVKVTLNGFTRRSATSASVLITQMALDIQIFV
eukprot:gene10492-8458_t